MTDEHHLSDSPHRSSLLGLPPTHAPGSTSNAVDADLENRFSQSSSELTSSDKLTSLPTSTFSPTSQAVPARTRTTSISGSGKAVRYSFDDAASSVIPASLSAPSLQTAPSQDSAASSSDYGHDPTAAAPRVPFPYSYHRPTVPASASDTSLRAAPAHPTTSPSPIPHAAVAAAADAGDQSAHSSPGPAHKGTLAPPAHPLHTHLNTHTPSDAPHPARYPTTPSRTTLLDAALRRARNPSEPIPSSSTPRKSPSPSRPRSRATSPIRLLQMGVSAFRAARTEHDHAREGTADGAPPRNAGGRGQRRGRRGRGRRGRRGRGDDDEDDEEEPFVPVDPWRLRARIRQLSLNTPHIPDLESGLHRVQSNLGIPPEAECHETLTSCLPSPPFLSSLRSHSFPLLRPLSLARVASPRLKRGLEDTWTHFTDTLPRQIYLHILLRLPSLYFARIARVFEDAELSKPDIERMVEACWEGDWASLPQGRSHSHGPRRTHGRSPGHAHHSPSPPPRLLGQGLVGSPRASLARGLGIGATSAPASLAAGNDDAHEEGGATDEWALPFPEEWVSGAADVPPSIVRFKRSWEEFIDSLLREWKTLNLVSALLLSAILSMFQNTQMSLDPLIRTPALISLTCALMSLSYGCVYIVRFGTMRTMHNALRWADEARHTETSIWWNVWVLLAMPAVWLAWSMVSFVVAILAFVWRSGADSDPQTPNQLGSRAVLGPRVGISMLFVLGVVYFGAMVRTLGSYGYGRRGAREAARYPPMHLYLSNSRPTSTSPPPPDYLERERDVGLVGARRPGAFTPPPAISPTPRTSLDDRDRVGRTVFPPDRGTGEPQRGRDRTTRRGADIGRPRRASDAQIPLSAVTGLGLMNLPGDGSGSGVNLSGSGNGNGNGNSEATPRSSDSLVMTEKEAL